MITDMPEVATSVDKRGVEEERDDVHVIDALTPHTVSRCRQEIQKETRYRME